MPKIMSDLTVAEGVHAVKLIRDICTTEKMVNTGNLRINYHAGDRGAPHTGEKRHDGSPARCSGSSYFIDVYNNLDYAQHVEHGFRSHFVPAKYLDSHYLEEFPDGMYVGKPKSFVRGKFMFRLGMRRLKQTQDARLKRKFNRIVKLRLEGKEDGPDDAE